MKTLILNTVENKSFNGIQFGFELKEKNEDGSNRVYYPFFQSLVSDSAIGKYLNVETGTGTKTEFLSES